MGALHAEQTQLQAEALRPGLVHIGRQPSLHGDPSCGLSVLRGCAHDSTSDVSWIGSSSATSWPPEMMLRVTLVKRAHWSVVFCSSWRPESVSREYFRPAPPSPARPSAPTTPAAPDRVSRGESGAGTGVRAGSTTC